MSSWKVLLCWENPVRNVYFNVIRGFNIKVRLLFTVTSIHCNNCWAQLAFADLFTTKAYSVVVSVYVHSLQSMVVAPKKYVWSTVWSSAQGAGGRTCHVATPFGVFVCVYCIRPMFTNLFLFLKSHIWLGPKFVTELGMSKGLCNRLLCVRVGLCCTLRRIMHFWLELVKQCICVSFTKVMVGVHMVF